MKNFFEDLFTLEFANNHLGDVKRAYQMIDECAYLLNYPLKFAIKFQIRDCESFVHKDHKLRQDVRYIRKVLDTKLEYDDYSKLFSYAKEKGFLTCATFFDEKSIDACKDFQIDIIKIASSDIKNFPLIDEVVKLNKPIIVSFGGCDNDVCDNLVDFFEANNINFAINHCVSLYPVSDEDLNLAKISYLKERYPRHTIGFSTHQKNDNLPKCILMARALGARIIERHIDIEFEGKIKRDYTTCPKDILQLVQMYLYASKTCFQLKEKELLTKEKEAFVIKKFQRGVYSKRDIKEGEVLCKQDFYYAIPCFEGQLTHNDIIEGLTLCNNIKKDEPIMENFVKMN